MRERHQTHDMSEFLTLAAHYRVLLQETDRTAALLRGVEQGRIVAQDDAERANIRLRQGVQRNDRSSRSYSARLLGSTRRIAVAVVIAAVWAVTVATLVF